MTPSTANLFLRVSQFPPRALKLPKVKYLKSFTCGIDLELSADDGIASSAVKSNLAQTLVV